VAMVVVMVMVAVTIVTGLVRIDLGRWREMSVVVDQTAPSWREMSVAVDQSSPPLCLPSDGLRWTP